MATRTRADTQIFTHDNFTASGTPSARTLPAKTNFVRISNVDGTNSLLYSLDGTHYMTVAPGKSQDLLCDNLSGLNSFTVKTSASTIAAECLYGSEA